MSLYEWCKYNNLDSDDIVKIEQAYYCNKTYKLESRLQVILNEWLCDPERLYNMGVYSL